MSANCSPLVLSSNLSCSRDNTTEEHVQVQYFHPYTQRVYRHPQELRTRGSQSNGTLYRQIHRPVVEENTQQTIRNECTAICRDIRDL